MSLQVGHSSTVHTSSVLSQQLAPIDNGFKIATNIVVDNALMVKKGNLCVYCADELMCEVCSNSWSAVDQR